MSAIRVDNQACAMLCCLGMCVAICVQCAARVRMRMDVYNQGSKE